MSRSARPLAALASIVTGVGLGVFALAPVAHADTTTTTFFYSGAEQSFPVPANVHTVNVVAVGGRGGGSADADNSPEPGGAGAMVSADVPVTPNTTLYVEVGGVGQDGSGDDASGGWNGGGVGKANRGAGGGGASDVRTIPAGTTGSLGSRLIVAAGGGGSAFGGPGGSSGSGGGTADPSCTTGLTPGAPGGGATTTSAGSGGGGGDGEQDGAAGSQGSGGDGGAPPGGSMGGGGGGGGYYGGGGGGAGISCAGGGGGGSSFLTAGGTYTGNGTDFGDRTSITISYTVPMTPLVTTTPASDITQTSARLNGVLTPETTTPPDAGALCYFDYGLDTSYGTQTSGGEPCGSGMGQVYYWATASNLTPGTTYYFRLVASNRYGFSYDVLTGQSFTTLPPPPAPAPTATTSPATNVGQHKATLNGVVNPNGTATSYHFDYGKTLAYGKHTATKSAGAGTTNVNVHAALSALPRHTTYHFRVVAVSTQGTTYGGDRTFRTG